MKRLCRVSRFKFLTYSFLAAALCGLTGNAWAAGPVDAASLPGGATVTDSDGGSGESWGRAGGRDILYDHSSDTICIG